MPGLLALFSDPDILRIDRPEAVWLVSGAGGMAWPNVEQTVRNFDLSGQEICRRYGDAVVAKIVLEKGQPVALAAWKGITSGYEIYYTVRPDGNAILADHFRNILSCVPLRDRRISDDALVDHFLFRRASPASAYCGGIGRLGHGEELSLEIGSGLIRTSIFDRIGSRALERTTNDHLHGLSAALASVLEPLTMQDGTVNLFSGGADATLIQTYLGSHARALTYLPETDSVHDAETAERSARLLGLEPQIHRIDEHNYAHALDATIEAIGVPPIRPHTVLIHDIIDLEFRRCVTGHGADALFGRNVRNSRLASLLSSRLGLSLLASVASVDKSLSNNRWQSRLSTARQMSEDPASPLGYGAQRGVIAQWDLIERAFGAVRLRERCGARLDYLKPRVDFVAPPRSPFLKHVEIAHWIEFLWEDRLTVLRHLAQAHGKCMVAPFFAKAVVDSATAIPVVERYMKGFEDKYLIKQLLKSRLPTYPIGQRKRSTRPPFERYYLHGPLQGLWERYQIPDFFDEAVRRHIVAHPSDLTWSAITFAIWKAKVLENPDLRRIPRTLTLEWA